MTGRARAVLITPDENLLTIQRIRPGHDRYWVLPGGGVEVGEDLESALARELREEIAATADVHSLLNVLQRGNERQYFYLARIRTWSSDARDRSGPEFADPARGEYRLDAIPLTAQALAAIDLKPDAFAEFLFDHLRAGTDVFILPDLRASLDVHPESVALRRPSVTPAVTVAVAPSCRAIGRSMEAGRRRERASASQPGRPCQEG